MDVVRDLLDTQMFDRDGREMGRVDAIEIDCRDGHPPRLTALLIGPSALGSRLHPALGRWATAIEQALGLDAGRPVRIDPGAITDPERDLTADLALTTGPAGAVELRLRGWLGRIGGGR